jgi:hypothetical protein
MATMIQRAQWLADAYNNENGNDAAKMIVITDKFLPYALPGEIADPENPTTEERAAVMVRICRDAIAAHVKNTAGQEWTVDRDAFIQSKLDEIE